MTSDNFPTVFNLPNVRLKDERSPIFLDIIRWMTSWKLRRNFAQIYIQNLEMAQSISVETGAVFALNHVSNWDISLFFELSELLSKHAFLFLPESQIQFKSYLRWCGTIPLNTDTPMLAHAQIRQTHKLSPEPTQFWMFPQHRNYSTHKPTLNFQPEIKLLSSHLEIPVIPVAIQYLYTDSEKPTVYISFQEPLPYHCSLTDIENSVKRGFTTIDTCHLSKDHKAFNALYKWNKTRLPSLFSQVLSMIAEWRLQS